VNRQNLFSDDWDGENEQAATRQRIFWRPDDARLGATLYELARNAPDDGLHMHFGAEEMFFVLSGRPVFRNQGGREELAPGDFVFCPEGRAGLHTFGNPTEEPARILAISAGSFPDVVAYPEDGYAWVATRDPDPALLARGGDPGIIARFEIPIE
jgi:mannose-6-phosphate isomerase-like protein (cupin superfamily)